MSVDFENPAPVDVDRLPEAPATSFQGELRAWDVVFLRATGVRARVNLAAQRLLDARLGDGPGFTHCALALGEGMVLEAYPHALKGAAGAAYPPGVRIVAMADLLAGTGATYRAVRLLRMSGERPAVDPFELARTMTRHRYGLRRFLGVRGSGEAEWLGCADLVVKALVAAGVDGLAEGRALGPGTLRRHLIESRWRPAAGQGISRAD